MDYLMDLIGRAGDRLWSGPLLILLIGTHLIMTIKTGFIQRKTFTAIRLSLKRDDSGKGDVSQFGALATALASTIGTGNIVGVGTAIALGGPGAVFWIWLAGVLGIATKYSEALIAVKYRVKTSDGTMLGGAMYALERGLSMKWTAALFAFFTALAAFGIGCSVQSNAVAEVFQQNFNIHPLFSGLAMTMLTAAVIAGGVKSVARVCEKLVPFMALFYFLGCMMILVINRAYLPDTVRIIMKAAFTPQAAGGGFVGSTILTACRYGIARGLFSNESGMGSAPIVAAAARTKNPVRQALVSATGTFWDTVVICAMTGLVLVSSILADPSLAAIQSNGGALTSLAFARIPLFGPVILTVGIVTFTFSTILGWSYYGEKAAEYLCGKKIIPYYRMAWIVTVFAGAALNLSIVWGIADILNGLMAIPNLAAVLLLSDVVRKETKYYLKGNRLEETDHTPIPVVRR